MSLIVFYNGSRMDMGQIILIITSGLVCYCGFVEFRTKKVRNEAVALIAALFFVYSAVTQEWSQIVINSGFATVLFFLMLYFYNIRLIAGGDLKLVAAAFLWVGPHCVVPFLFFGALVIVLQIAAEKIHLVHPTASKSAALAPSICIALIATFVVGCLDESSRSIAVEHGLSWLNRLIYLVFPWAPHSG